MKSKDLDWSELYKTGHVDQQDPGSKSLASTLPEGDVSNKGGEKISKSDLINEAMGIIRSAHSTPGTRQPTDEELFGHLVVSEDELEKKKQEWGDTLNGWYQEANKPIQKQPDNPNDWGRGPILDELSEEEREAWNMHDSDK
jgi:hypothetical protein